jgi:hypothetical protein
MGRSLNTLKGSDVTVTPIKLKYSNQIPSASLSSNNITLTIASNQSFDYNNPSYGDNFLLYRSVQGLYYMNFISGSMLGSASAYEWSPQSTAASGTFDNDYRYFPTESNAQVLVISIPRAKYGENIARASFSMSSSAYNIIDDGNGNLVDAAASNTHVGNLLYNQGVGIITNVDYLYALIPIPVCDVPVIETPIPSGETTAAPRWIVPTPPASYEYILSTSSAAPIGSGTSTIIYTNTGSVSFTGLSSSTDYYFFLRTKCSSTSYSSWVSESFTTNIGLVPFRDGLILELESFTGSVTSSGYVTQWMDMSGLGNDVYRDVTQYQPVYISSYFNGQPAIFFSGSIGPTITGSVLRTSGVLSGLSGSAGMTAFVVARPSSSAASGPVVEYAKSGSSTDSYLNSTGSFQYYQTFSGGNIVTISGETGGNVGLSTVDDSTVRAQSQFAVQTMTIDYTLSSKEVVIYTNNATGSLTWSGSNNSGSLESYPFAIGSGVNNGKWQAWQGYIGAVLLYDKVLTESERTQVYNYLSSSYL